MAYLKGVYDSSSNRLMVSFETNLVETQWDYFKKTIEDAAKCGTIHEKTEVQKLGAGRCLITIPIFLEGTEDMRDGDRMENLPPEVSSNLTYVLEEFVTSALSREFQSVEFIPLSGYSLKNLKEDLLEAIRNKKDLLLVDSYRSYDLFSKRIIGKIKQKRIAYHTKEYAEIALKIHDRDKKALRQLMKELKTVKWV